MRKVRISVRRLVEFVRRSGSIDNRMTSSDRALEGTKIHQLLQKEAGEEYAAEVRLNLDRIVDGIAFSLDGRADGIINGRMIDEIKTTETPMDEITESIMTSSLGATYLLWIYACRKVRFGRSYSTINVLSSS